VPFNLTGEICKQAQYQVLYGHRDQYRVETLAATSFNGIVQELRPTDPATDLPDVVNTYAGRLLRILLALGQRPRWIRGAIESIGAQAVQRQRQPRYDG
jgi:hypothetical protein